MPAFFPSYVPVRTTPSIVLHPFLSSPRKRGLFPFHRTAPFSVLPAKAGTVPFPSYCTLFCPPRESGDCSLPSYCALFCPPRASGDCSLPSYCTLFCPPRVSGESIIFTPCQNLSIYHIATAYRCSTPFAKRAPMLHLHAEAKEHAENARSMWREPGWCKPAAIIRIEMLR